MSLEHIYYITYVYYSILLEIILVARSATSSPISLPFILIWNGAHVNLIFSCVVVYPAWVFWIISFFGRGFLIANSRLRESFA